MIWQQFRIKDIACNKGYGLVDGPFGSNLPGAAYTEEGVPIVRGVNLSLGKERFKDFDYVFVSEDTASKLRRSLCEPDDVVFTKKGTLGQTGIIPRNSKYRKFLLSSNQMKLSVNTEIAYPLYVYYFVSSPHSQRRIKADAMTTGVPKINLTYLRNFQIPLPLLEVQKKIAAILSAYDDLIENNKRRIALLEKMAEEIYREWFVRMRFPGHEKAKVVKGVPEGWELRPFSEVVEINPPETIDKDEEKPFVGMEDLSLTSMFFVSKESRKGSSGSKFRNRDVLFPRITPSVENGKRGFVMTLRDDQVAFGSTEFIVMREKIIGPEHIYFITCSSGFRKHAELSMVGASGRQRVQENCFTFFLVKTPLLEVRTKFSELMGTMFSKIHLLSRQTTALSVSRDLLLPRLISGKLCVEDLDIHFPPSMHEQTTAEQLELDFTHA